MNYGENCVAFESLIRHDVLHECYGPHFRDAIETHAEMVQEMQSFQVHLLFKRGSVNSYRHWTIVNVRPNDS